MAYELFLLHPYANTGEKMGAFGFYEIPRSCWNISVRGDEMVAACGQKGGVSVFKIIR